MSKHQHYWLETGVPHILVWINLKFRYDCAVCGKQKYFQEQPLNPIVPSAHDVYRAEIARGNAHLVVFPPMQIGTEDQYLEGERYAKLLRRQS